MLKEVKDTLNLGAPFNLVIPKRNISQDEQMLIRRDQIVPGKIATIEAEIMPAGTYDEGFREVDVVILSRRVNGRLISTKAYYGPEINKCTDLKSRIRHY